MAIPLARTPERHDPYAQERPQTAFVAACEEVLARWQRTPARAPEPGPRVSRVAQWRTARAARGLVDELAVEVEACPPAGRRREEWKRRVEERIRAFGESRLGWPAGYRDLLLGAGFYRASLVFARRTRDFAPELPTAELFQALRNVWIANSLQLLLRIPVECTDALFAYSLLYPVTDNHLDDPSVPALAKMAFNRSLGARLAGEPVRAREARESAAFRLVALLEATRPRESSPEVWESLLAIQRAQEGSLLQQGGTPLEEAQILALSLAKGAASVWADAALVAARLDEGVLRFAVGYGLALQLLDDLQDARCDRDAGHRTLFSTALAAGPLDDLVARLLRFVTAVVDDEPRFAAPDLVAARDLIRRNCTTLLVGAVAEDPALCSRRFVRRLQRRWPLAFAAQRGLSARARRRWGRAAGVLSRRFEGLSWLDVLAAEEAAPAA